LLAWRDRFLLLWNGEIQALLTGKIGHSVGKQIRCTDWRYTLLYI
jgi:hypothetical protein